MITQVIRGVKITMFIEISRLLQKKREASLHLRQSLLQQQDKPLDFRITNDREKCLVLLEKTSLAKKMINHMAIMNMMKREAENEKTRNM